MRVTRSTCVMRSVSTVVLLLVAAWAGLVVFAPSAAATTYVQGAITTNTIWGDNDSVYIATKNVTVKAAATLTIRPNTTVRFDPGVHLFVEGRLYADGALGKPITFAPNNSVSITPWGGVQFNASSFGSVSWATFDHVDRAVTAISSSPDVHDNTVLQAGIGFAFVSSASIVSGNVVRRAGVFGIYLNASNARVFGNSINGTSIGIDVEQPSTPSIYSNTITNVSGPFAVGIFVVAGATADLSGNVIRGILGPRGGNGIAPGSSGREGGIALGIYVAGAPTATVTSNSITTVVGGRGGDGAANPAGIGGAGGAGGAAAGIVVASTASVLVEGNTVTGLSGGRGGTGGGSATTSTGGRGGDAGAAIGVEIARSNTLGLADRNTINGMTGGIGGSGGQGSPASGSGGRGGDAYGMFLVSVANADASSNTIQVVRGGLGGNTSGNGAGSGDGAGGGSASGIAVFSVVGSARVHANTIETLTGGDGGRGQRGGHGGNATGIIPLGNNDGSFNATSMTFNQIDTVTGGAGGIGGKFGGDGGSATGAAAIYLTPTLSGNGILTLSGGRGGDAIDGSDGGRGGDAAGVVGGLIANGWSSGDAISSVTKGGPGAGPPAQTSYANGYYVVGNGTFTSRLTAENATFTSVGSFEFYVENYTDAVSVNTPFTNYTVRAAGNLTVRNFLEVDAFWPNGVTPVAGARVLVEDNGATVWDRIAPSGIQPWILVTDRRYINSNVATENQTTVTVTYGSESFQNNGRDVNMATSHSEAFVMIDRNDPTSAATPLPTYENAFTFFVGYTADDGNGTGVGNVTLWYRSGGGWTPYATQPADPFGQFSFTASSDGVYEFATTVDDLAGNKEPGPSANDTWTIVDTVRPGSHVNPLPAYETANSFLVTWAPDAGVMDIVTYTVQYTVGAGGWSNWLVDTAAPSGTFTASTQGIYAFRSIARDAAGNVELPPAGNDTWTIVDTSRPFSHTLPLPTFQTSTSFLVSWEPQFDTTDIASYKIQAKDDAGLWTDWILSTTPTSSTFNGQDGHTYQFRSLATDRAGNVELPPITNDSWTIVDVTPPDSAVARLPAFENALQFTLLWGPASGTLDIVAYRVQFKDGAGAWTDLAGYTDTALTSAPFLGQDTHVYAFRTMARDRAGNVEPTPAGNDTWTIVDVTPPSVVARAPEGANTNTTPAIVITFSEPMNRASVQLAFSMTPAMNGQFYWSADNRTVTFIPERQLLSGTTYAVVVDRNAKDVAGNGMAGSVTFQFSTVASASFLSDFWWVLLVVGALVGGALFLIMRRRAAASAPKPVAPATTLKGGEAILEDVFLLYHRDGLLIKHETRRLRPDIDTDILSGMLTAVQAFVKDALRGDDSGDLNEMTVGHMHILIGRGKWLVLAARIEGDGSESWTDQIQRCIQDMEDHRWDQLEDWDGDMALAGVLAPYVKKLIRGEYA